MKTQDEVMTKLTSLGKADRQWILERLSPKVRKTLFDSIQAGTNTPANADPQRNAQRTAHNGVEAALVGGLTPDHTRLLRNTAPRELAKILAKEPAWIAHALLTQNWPWRDVLPKLLPADLRRELQELDARGVKYPPQIGNRVAAAVAERVVLVEPETEGWSLDSMLQSVRTRAVRRRMKVRQ